MLLRFGALLSCLICHLETLWGMGVGVGVRGGLPTLQHGPQNEDPKTDVNLISLEPRLAQLSPD